MTTTRTIQARNLVAGDTLIFRSRLRAVLSDATLDLDDDGNAFADVVLEAMQGEPLNACLPADEAVAVIR